MRETVHNMRTPETAAQQRIARAPQAIRKENEHHSSRVERVFLLPLCVVFKAYAICLRIHLLPGKEESPGSQLKNELMDPCTRGEAACRQLWFRARGSTTPTPPGRS